MNNVKIWSGHTEIFQEASQCELYTCIVKRTWHAITWLPRQSLFLLMIVSPGSPTSDHSCRLSPQLARKYSATTSQIRGDISLQLSLTLFFQHSIIYILCTENWCYSLQQIRECYHICHFKTGISHPTDHETFLPPKHEITISVAKSRFN